MAKCKDCGAEIKWFQAFLGMRWVPFNAEDVDDNFDIDKAEPHTKTCRKPEEKPLTVEQRTRPGYL